VLEDRRRKAAGEGERTRRGRKEELKRDQKGLEEGAEIKTTQGAESK
jgi:hypothetical protein